MASLEFTSKRVQTDDEWMDIAECRGLTEVFFPPIAERPQARERREAMARTVCLQCAVLKKNGMPPGIGSLRQSAFAPLLSAKSFPPSHARMSAV